MAAGRPASNTISRARLGLPRSGTTVPNAIAWMQRGSTLWRSTRPRTACVARASGPSLENAWPALTKGVRAPATMATLGVLMDYRLDRIGGMEYDARHITNGQVD